MSMEYMSKHYLSEFRKIVREAGNPLTEYPFAASCVSIAFSILLFFKLNRRTSVNPSGSASGNRLAVKQFVRLSMAHPDCFDEVFTLVTIRVHTEWMNQLAVTSQPRFDIHYFAVALNKGIGAMSDLFNHKRIKDLSDLRVILV